MIDWSGVGSEDCRFIDVRAFPEQGGTVTGRGYYDDNASVTVTATPKAGFTFKCWQENGAQVSTARNYTFTATRDRELKAVFESNSWSWATENVSSLDLEPEAGQGVAVLCTDISAAGSNTVTVTASEDCVYDLITIDGSTDSPVEKQQSMMEDLTLEGARIWRITPKMNTTSCRLLSKRCSTTAQPRKSISTGTPICSRTNIWMKTTKLSRT